MFRTIRELTRQFIPKTGALKGKDGELILEKKKFFRKMEGVHNRVVKNQ
jgi:hypothetical protein